MLLWSDLCAGGDRDEEAEKRSLQVQIPNAQKRNQGLFSRNTNTLYASVDEGSFIHKYKSTDIAKQVQMLRTRMYV